MKTIGIITIHKINNYGSVLQAYALQKTCEDLGYNVEIIDYNFPNKWQFEHLNYKRRDEVPPDLKWIKYLFGLELYKQHKRIRRFVDKYHHLTKKVYTCPEDLEHNAPIYNIYITGSDQLWSPKHCKGDPAFMLHFAPENAKRISYAASVGENVIPDELKTLYRELISKYSHISVRENSGVTTIQNLVGKDAMVVVDPTLLLNKEQWLQIATPKRLFKKKYILCYYLNYSYNGYPYIDNIANHFQQETGYEIVKLERPPYNIVLNHTHYKVGSSPEDFLALFRDAEIILTTSFHGTAFGLNFGKPLFSIIESRRASDSRQLSLMQNVGLDKNILTISDPLPSPLDAYYDFVQEQAKLEDMRKKSLEYLRNALKDE